MRFVHANIFCKTQPSSGDDSGGVRRYQIAAVAGLSLISAWLGAWAWERARPERHLTEAARHLREGRPEEASLEDYTSHNTQRLTVPQIEELLLALPDVQRELAAWQAR